MIRLNFQVLQSQFSMEELKFEYLFHNLSKSSYPNLLKEIYLWIWKPNEPAPHIGISCNGKYFSLKTNGKEMDNDANKKLRLSNLKSTPLVLLEIIDSITLHDIKKAFGKYERAFTLNTSCLQPISNIFNLPSKKLTELLFKLDEQNKVGIAHIFNLEQKEVGIISYEIIEIEKKLISLKNAKRK